MKLFLLEDYFIRMLKEVQKNLKLLILLLNFLTKKELKILKEI